MPRTSKARKVSQDSRLHIVSSVLRRDPLLRQFRDLYCHNILNTQNARRTSISELKANGEQQRQLQKRICQRYRIPGFWSNLDPSRVSENEWLESVNVMSNHVPIMWATNWGKFYSSSPSIDYIPNKGTRWKPTAEAARKAPPRPVDPFPYLTVQLNLSQINGRDINKAAVDIKTILKRCLEELPEDLSKPSSTWERNTDRDLRRFLQHIEHGVPFRVIAFWERRQRIPDRPLGFAVPKESSVRESVNRIYKTIYGTPYRARSKNYQRLEHNVKRYNCPNHGQDCGSNCPYAMEFIKKHIPEFRTKYSEFVCHSI